MQLMQWILQGSGFQDKTHLHKLTRYAVIRILTLSPCDGPETTQALATQQSSKPPRSSLAWSIQAFTYKGNASKGGHHWELATWDKPLLSHNLSNLIFSLCVGFE